MTRPARSVVVVGGGVAGLSTVAALRSGGFDGEVTLIDEGDRPYDRPPLSKDYLAGKKTLSDLTLQDDAWYASNDIRLLAGTRAAAVRPDTATIETTDGKSIGADRVVLATGGGATRPPIPGLDGDRVHVLRTADDADRLRKALLPGARVLVVGAGLIGAEVASTAVGLGADVTLVDPVARPLAAAVGDEVADWLHQLHGERGIRTRCVGVVAVDATPEGMAVKLADGTRESFDAVVLGVGMTPATELADAAGLDVDAGIVVDAGQTTSNAHILAVGDPTRRRVSGLLLPRAEHWEAAQHDGGRAAATILGLGAPGPTAPWFWSDRHGFHVEVVGRMSTARSLAVRGTLGAAPFSVFGVADGLVVGAVAVDDSNAVRAARRLIDRRVPVDVDELADPGTDLRRLLRR